VPLDVLKDVSLQVNRGESVAVVGPSGSGKSTLLNILGTLDQPSSGEVWFDGTRIDNLIGKAGADLRRDRIGFIFQMHHLMPQCTAIENVLLPTLARSPAPRGGQAYERAASLLDSVGLGKRVHHMPGQLSGGECQRVAVVRALINEPDLILADEPTGSLDAASAEEVWSILSHLSRERGVATIAVTHAAALAEKMDRVFEFFAGHLAGHEATR
jgi:ABC-type lipoprotein export system ATPase subunit